ncbi:MAG TPA: CTP-dependent riboflavin kinase [Ignisphaera aggregans]|uniref:Riboflavin kinase n=1 Tax=Ignisphaera aggregans TaxID=334771 RepID=A0A832Z007_9CREN|nr:CTP-dependent riboflavin kinase [Ignisphaera aggregans]
MKQGVVVKGRVFSGRGEGEFFVSLYAKNIAKAVGYTPYPGTLNIALEPEYIPMVRKALDRRLAIVVEPPVEGFHRIYLWRAAIQNMEVHVVKPEVTHYGDDVIEVIAPIPLRKALMLSDGDLVEVLLLFR